MFQQVEQTYEEKVKMYNKLTKRQLIDMLIESNRLLSSIQPVLYIHNEKVIGPSVHETCDVCGRHPNPIIKTASGRFCSEHVMY